ncbi:sugar kinase [Saccharibacillus endophyticus]|uniref:2-dehydro-3-deoxygluconokinase n=1 Tax=Saccharibacillus endophyticus TaxID=2060666 RepID=A0ABQ2A1D7_9BACL|nr:sugar kinase [Saccharibacillus endophyticus]GGH84286.1 2-dehydro-3-deoxygluconokinase [Saccharibacillus endophyticus]
MQDNRVDVVTLGESMILFQSYNQGALQYEPLFTKSLAGAESNVAIGLSRLGKKTRWVGRLGSDPFGDLVLTTLSGQGVDVSHAVRDNEAPTAVYFKDFKRYGDPAVYYYRKGSAASRLSPEMVDEAWLEGAGHLHVTGITPALGDHTAAATRKLMESAREKGLTVSFDPNLRRKLWSEETARETLLSLIPLCDIFMPGDEEAEFLLGKLEIEAYGEAFLNMGPKLVAMKLGAEGSIGFTEKASVRAEPFAVDRLIDTVGAGDAFASGLLSVLLDHREEISGGLGEEALHEALHRANLLGSMATQFKGDWEGLPTLAEVRGILDGEKSVTR